MNSYINIAINHKKLQTRLKFIPFVVFMTFPSTLKEVCSNKSFRRMQCSKSSGRKTKRRKNTCRITSTSIFMENSPNFFLRGKLNLNLSNRCHKNKRKIGFPRSIKTFVNGKEIFTFYEKTFFKLIQLQLSLIFHFLLLINFHFPSLIFVSAHKSFHETKSSKEK